MTNREWMNSLSAEELAQKLEVIADCCTDLDTEYSYEKCLFAGRGCAGSNTMVDWLKAERTD